MTEADICSRYEKLCVKLAHKGYMLQTEICSVRNILCFTISAVNFEKLVLYGTVTVDSLNQAEKCFEDMEKGNIVSDSLSDMGVKNEAHD